MPAVAAAPRHLWIVGALALLWNAFGAYDYLMTQTQNASYMAKFTQEQLDYFYGLPTWHVAMWAIAVWGSVAGSVLLLLRKRAADPVFLVAFVAMVVSTIGTTIGGGWQVMGGAGPIIFSAVIFLVALALWLYARAMRMRGVLG